MGYEHIKFSIKMAEMLFGQGFHRNYFVFLSPYYGSCN